MANLHTDKAYQHIRQRILSGAYAPGQALQTNTLSEEIGVSRTPVRDALRQLETEGLVTIRPRLGAQVRSMDFKQFRDVCGLRLALEVYAAGLAAHRRTEEELIEIKSALDAMGSLVEQMPSLDGPAVDEALERLKMEDIRFHVGILGAARNEAVKGEIFRLHLLNRVVVTPAISTVPEREQDLAHRREVQSEHTRIFEAIQRSDVAESKNAMEAHLQASIDATLRLLARAERGQWEKKLSAEEMSYTV